MDSVPRPADLFGRQREWAELSAFVTDPDSGPAHRRRSRTTSSGKVLPAPTLEAAVGGFYYQALEHEPAQALVEIGEIRLLGGHLGVGRLALADWDEAVSSFRRIASGPGPAGEPFVTSPPGAAILDEFPYLLERSPELPSLLQRAVDRSTEEHWPAIRLILCGSA